MSIDTADRDAIMRARQQGQVRELRRLHAADRALVEEREELAEVRDSVQQAEREIGRLRAEHARCAPLARRHRRADQTPKPGPRGGDVGTYLGTCVRRGRGGAAMTEPVLHMQEAAELLAQAKTLTPSQFEQLVELTNDCGVIEPDWVLHALLESLRHSDPRIDPLCSAALAEMIPSQDSRRSSNGRSWGHGWPPWPQTRSRIRTDGSCSPHGWRSTAPPTHPGQAEP